MSPGVRFVRRFRLACIIVAFTLCVQSAALAAGAKRLVVVKVDGLPHDTVERFVRRRDPRTGKSLLPWFEHVFYERGTRWTTLQRGLQHKFARPPGELFDEWQLGIRGRAAIDDRITLDRALARLPPGYRAAFILHDIEGYQHEEVARILGCAAGTSKSQLHKARKQLRHILNLLS